ncbi:hypothetical protein CANCADRAFT_575 [Tortispora caseinolytica NRRL Y-17796]|uniref:Uncharacterized protein n=1 Tax=Tortispora caseinolytica NRRL Y-17796 TaxID=767744 RepID=A0A1E4TJR2_9ASCO|nr:hypothetical protein CANCADRAFT_575 [Tortispora caseinolytica NRRL Y-17796]
MPAWEYIAKIVMIGDSACGKSSLTIRLTDSRFVDGHEVTIAAEIGTKVMEVGDNKRMKLQIWDTAGQEHFRSITKSYFRNAAGCILVYDVTRRETFDNIQKWLDDVRDLASPNISICLVGNKIDMSNESRQVSTEEAYEFSKANKLTAFVEASAKTGDQVEKSYKLVADDIYSKIVSGQVNLGNPQNGVKAPQTNWGIDVSKNDAKYACC